ncbi:glycoside hydrolase domain-containing protein [Streptomyces canus]|uniref:glycoside hydrolase domain-containing protein n=1 Tax=Streptomyces canus TaxID=58343 RepID=UPI0027D92694|nr:glycoside hydrolase domain-containing protein [Streptomyces canus]
MRDAMVLKAQRFVNSVYGSRTGTTVEESGEADWATMYALTRALQYELGITPLSDNFGPGTLSTLAAKFPKLDQDTVPSPDFCRIIQAGLYCKGYDGSDLDGTYGARVQAAVTKLKTDIGVEKAFPGSDLTPKVFKALLTMDAYVITGSGSDQVRDVQRWLNGRYVDRQDYFVVACDGQSSAATFKGLLLGIQYELGMADGTANGNFGPGTQSGLKSHPVKQGDQSVWVSLFSAGMVLNRRPVALSDSFESPLAAAVRAFQAFVALPSTGDGDFSTWASLLASFGDQSRQGQACDGIVQITPARAATLKAAGIKYVGRYLTNPSGKSLPEKAIQPGELQTITENGLRCFPIYQTTGDDVSDFDYAAGRTAGYAAVNAALDHGFKNGTRIFFSVDFDAVDDQITESILPHFKGINEAMADSGNPYEIGVYGSRDVCARVGGAGYSTASFLADMSPGFVGNAGHQLPDDWAYDQFVIRTLGSDDAQLASIDINIASGRDTGQGSFNRPRPAVPDVALDRSYLPSLRSDLSRYMQSIGYADAGGIGTDAKLYSNSQAVDAIQDQDELITQLSNTYTMRKALIQTAVYWAMRDYSLADQAVDQKVVGYHLSGSGTVKDSHTGIAEISGTDAIQAWNHCIGWGYTTGKHLDAGKDADIWSVWQRLNKDNAFTVRTVALIHLWDLRGRPGGWLPPGDRVTTPRTMRLGLAEFEITELLRRYRAWDPDQEAQTHQSMAVYQLFEKYNSIARNA